MLVTTHNGDVRAALLIPTKGRAALMLKLLPKMRTCWNRKGVHLAIENKERKQYLPLLKELPKVKVIWFDNPMNSVGLALDTVRRDAVRVGYDYYVMADDNTTFTREGFDNLVRATAEWGKPVHMAGSHPTASFFDKGRIRRTLVKKHGISTYRKMAWIFRCVPHELYSEFAYPADLYCYADRYFSMWLISKGYFEFRCTPDAPFNKRRFVQGGIGEKHTRSRSALGLARMATDFAQEFGPLEVRIPWEEIIKLNQQKRKPKKLVLKRS